MFELLQKKEIPLQKVDSDLTATAIRKEILKIKNVEEVEVQTNNQLMIVKYDEAPDYEEIQNKLKFLGHFAAPKKENFPVLEMSCAACASSVEKVLNKQKGVISATVNFADNSANLTYFPQLVQLDNIRYEVRKSGYDIITETPEEGLQTHARKKQSDFDKLVLKTIGAGVFAVPIFFISMFFSKLLLADLVMWFLSTPVVFWFGRSFFKNAWIQTKNKTANMDTLVALGTGVAYTFSVIILFIEYFIQPKDLVVQVYFEAAAVIIFFVLLGKVLEERAKGKSGEAIKKLMGLKPKTVKILEKNGTSKEIPISEVKVGDVIALYPGEKVAVDGSVRDGKTYIDESMLTGESAAVLKKTGSKVFAGTVNQNGSIRYFAEKLGADTLLANIINLVKQAQGSKPPIQKLVDKVAAVFVPTVLGIAFFSLIVWGISGNWMQAFVSFATVLVIACPCALGLATPTALMVGIGKAAESGILIKDANSLEIGKKINTIVLDKTGTITKGNPELIGMQWLDGDDHLLNILLAMEKMSEHPLARAVEEGLKNKKLKDANIEDFKSITGKGLFARHKGKIYRVGNKKWLKRTGIEIPDKLELASELWLNQAFTVFWFSEDNKALACIAIADSIKETSAAAVKKMQALGLDIWMLTGDNIKTATAIARQCGIKNFKAELLPDEKVNFVKTLQNKNQFVAMVGDGINDSPALAQADLSIAMGKGSDIAMNIAQMTIINNDLINVSEAINIAKLTTATIRQNLFWAFIYNIVGIPLAAGLFYPFTGLLLNPMWAGMAMAMSSVSVVSNSLRLKFKN